MRHLTYANLVASIALVVALGGTSYAALKLPRDSVHAKQIAEGAVGRSEVRDGSLTLTEFRPDVSFGVDARLSTQTLPDDFPQADCSDSCTFTVGCEDGRTAISGGVVAPNPYTDVDVLVTGPVVKAHDDIPSDGWRVTIRETPKPTAQRRSACRARQGCALPADYETFAAAICVPR